MRIKCIAIYGLILLLVIMELANSCTPQQCFENTDATVNGSFYKAGSDKPATADSITIYGIGKESTKIYDKAKNVTKISLPLNASTEKCGFVIKINNTVDTLRFSYSSYPHLISKECGISFYFYLDSYLVSGTKVDTIIIRNNNITTFNEENIRIFY
jgi:hypothetical protein